MARTSRFPRPPIVFLDIDGVGNTCRAMAALDRPDDPIAYGLIKRLCSRHFCEIVISSSWRNDVRLMPLLAGHGLIDNLSPDWRTGELDSRSREIADWLERDGEDRTYWILDDETFDFTPNQLERLIQTDTYNGLGLLEWERLDQALREHDHPGRLSAAMGHREYAPAASKGIVPGPNDNRTWGVQP